MTKTSFFRTKNVVMWGLAVLLGHGVAMPQAHGDSSMFMSSWGSSSQSSTKTTQHKGYTETVTTKRATENGTETETTITERCYDDGRKETTTQTKTIPHRQAKSTSSLNNYSVHTKEENKGEERIQTTTETWQEGSVQVTKITTKVLNTKTQSETTTVKETRAPLASHSDTEDKTGALPKDDKNAASAPAADKGEEEDKDEEDEEEEEGEDEKEEKEKEKEKERLDKKQAWRAQDDSHHQKERAQPDSRSTLASKGSGLFHQRPGNLFANLFQDSWWTGGWGKDFFSGF